MGSGFGGLGSVGEAVPKKDYVKMNCHFFLKKRGVKSGHFQRVIVFYDANNIAAAGVNDATFNGDVQSVIGPWRPLIKIGGYLKT